MKRAVPDRVNVPPPHALGHALRANLDQIAQENETLSRELLRCHGQLNLVFDLTERIGSLRDPEAVQTILLQRFGGMLQAGALFLDRGGCCQRIELEASPARRIDVAPELVRAAFGSQVEFVRRNRRVLLPVLPPEDAAPLAGAHSLLGALQRADAGTGVVIVLRDPEQPSFDAGDVLASDTVLAYGAQVLTNVVTVHHLQRTTVETVCTLVNAIDAKDNYTSAHSERVGGFARLLGEALGLPKPRLQNLEWVGLLHDVGKIGIPEQILNKPGSLTPLEYEQMKRHAQIGFDVLKPVAQFAPVLDSVLYHHENHDGSGYPEGLRGEQVPLEARIVHVVDVFDALTTTRPYRDAYEIGPAIDLLAAGAGRVTDPEVTRLFLETLRKYMAAEPDGFRARFGHLLERKMRPRRAGNEPGSAVGEPR